MTDARWEEIDELFQRALDLPPDERAGFLADECADDPELRSAIEELLEASTHPFLETSIEELCELPWEEIFPPPPGETSDEEAPSFDRSGQQLGPYRLIRRLGRGGMATVYLAERNDEQWEQRVAIKILRRGLDTEDVVRRFFAERQILSTLDHPNVARLLDGGSTAEGLPYLVMEYVEGTPITAYCEERGLSVSDRLALFCDVGRAVQAAHRHLVVHRDLKPSNILVDSEGKVKLLDFGIAKILDPAGEVEFTRTGLRPLTLAYASPEQVRGGPVTTTSDVYQLGLVLTEMLTGRRPYELKVLSPARAERAILEAEPRRPSALVTPTAAKETGTSAKELARRLRGDVDTIVLHALRKDPEERYHSAGSLVDDVERHMEGQPVSVRPDSPGYRARKFVARHRALVLAASLAVLLLGGSTAVSVIQAERAQQERDRALQEATRAERVTDFISDLFRIADPDLARGEPIAAPALLAAGVARADSQLAGQPRARAEVLSTIGRLYQDLGMVDPARQTLEDAVLLRREVGDEPSKLADDLRRLASVVGPYDPERAIELVEEAIALAEEELAPGHPVLAASLTTAAEIRPLESGRDAAERKLELADSAVVMLRAYEGERDVRPQLAGALHASGRGRGLDGLPNLEEALRIRRSLYGEDHTAVAATLNDMGLVLERFDPAAADTLIEKALEIHERIHGPDHARTLSMMSNLAGRYREKGEYERAEPLYREALRRRQEAYPRDSLRHAYPMHGLGWSLAELGRPDEAVPLLRDVLEILGATGVETESVLYQTGRSTLGRALAVRGDYEAAEPLLRDSYEWVASSWPQHPVLPDLLDRVVALYEDWGRPGRAAEYREHLDALSTPDAGGS